MPFRIEGRRRSTDKDEWVEIDTRYTKHEAEVALRHHLDDMEFAQQLPYSTYRRVTITKNGDVINVENHFENKIER